MRHDSLVLAYLAGMIDGDGFISIVRSARGEKVYHAPQIGIAGTRREPHDLAASLWGGAIYRYEPKNKRHRAQFQWSLQGERAAVAIRDVQPYLRIKVEQAQLALELWEHIGFGRSDDPFPWFGSDYDIARSRDLLREEMIGINQSRRRAVAV